MSQNDMKASALNDDKLDAINGGITLKPDSGFFSGTYECQCGCNDFRIFGVLRDGKYVEIECKRCGAHYNVYN